MSTRIRESMSNEEAVRLFALDESLRREGEEFLIRTGIGRILAEAGFHPVGSYVTRTMVWRDLDFERAVDAPDWSNHWAVGAAISRTGFAYRLNCVDAYRDPSSPDNNGFYWGVRAALPDGPAWKLDIWTGRPEEYGAADEMRDRWAAAMTEDARARILSIKEAVYGRPEYRKSMLSVHIYQAVLDEGVSSLDEFQKWWMDRARAEGASS